MKTLRMARLAALVLATGIGSAALAQSDGMLTTYSATDSKLKWGGCPEGLPKGCQLAVVNGDVAKPNSDVFLKLPGNSKVPSHKHTSAERIVLMQGTLAVAYEGMKPARVGKGAYLYGPAGVVHSAECVSKEPCLLFIAFEQPVDFIQTPMADAAAKPAATATTSSAKKPKKGGC